MRILNLSATYFVQTFRDLGHDVLTVGSRPGLDVVLNRCTSLRGLKGILDSRGFVPDFALWCDACRPPSVVGLESLPCPTLFFTVDQYLNPWHVPYAAAFDHVFAAQKDYLRLFEHPKFPDRVIEWLPLFSPDLPDLRPAEPPLRDIPASFVGTVGGAANPDRKTFLDGFRRLAPLYVGRGDFVPVYRRSQVVVNQSAAGELNFRIFEAMGCGACLITEDAANGLRDLFMPGRDLLVYPRGDHAEAARLTLAALKGGWTEVAESGRQRVLARHTATARARRLLAVAVRLLQRQTYRQRLANMDLVGGEVRKAYSILALDERLPLPAEQREFYLGLSAAPA